MAGRGGARPGAGRKKKEVVAVRERSRAEAKTDAEYALALFIRVMRDETNTAITLSTRLDAAKEVMDRTWGKASQPVQIEGNERFDAFAAAMKEAREERSHGD